MKIEEIVVEAAVRHPDFEADKEYVRKNREAMTPEQRAASDKNREDAMEKHRAMLARKRAKQCPDGKHDWEMVSDNKRGVTTYRCKTCPASKTVDSTD